MDHVCVCVCLQRVKQMMDRPNGEIVAMGAVLPGRLQPERARPTRSRSAACAESWKRRGFALVGVGVLRLRSSRPLAFGEYARLGPGQILGVFHDCARNIGAVVTVIARLDSHSAHSTRSPCGATEVPTHTCAHGVHVGGMRGMAIGVEGYEFASSWDIAWCTPRGMDMSDPPSSPAMMAVMHRCHTRFIPHRIPHLRTPPDPPSYPVHIPRVCHHPILVMLVDTTAAKQYR